MDEGTHHTSPNDKGRIVIQGLLTATLSTKIGGENDVLAHTMNFNLLKPVYSGDTITCEASAVVRFTFAASNPL